MPVDEHGTEIDADWEPESPVLRGETQVPDEPGTQSGRVTKPDELPHRYRRQLGIDNPDPDPGYDPDADDLVVPA